MASTKPQVFNRYSISDTFAQPWFNNLISPLSFKGSNYRYQQRYQYKFLIFNWPENRYNFFKNNFLLYFGKEI